MLDIKDIKILGVLLKVRLWENVQTMIRRLEMTRSNLNYHLEHINHYLRMHKMEVIDLKYKQLKNYDQIAEFYTKYVKENKFIALNTEERQLVILVLLLFGEKIKLTDLKAILGISINTAFTDLHKISLELLSYNRFWWDHTLPQLVSTTRGCYIQADNETLHRILVNTLIKLINIDDNETLLYFILNNVHFDDYKVLKNNHLTNNGLYALIFKHVVNTYETLPYVNAQSKIVALLLFLVFTRKFRFELDEAETNHLAQLRTTINHQVWFQASSALIDTLKRELHFVGKVGNFEKLFIGQLLSSQFQPLACDDLDQEKKQYEVLLEEIMQRFKKLKYTFKENCNFFEFINYCLWFHHLPFPRLLVEHNKKQKTQFFSKAFRSQYFFNDFKKIFFTIMEREHPLTLEEHMYDLAIIFYHYVKTLPFDADKKQHQDVVVVTNLKGGVINAFLAVVRQNDFQTDDLKVISLAYYLQHKDQFKKHLIISEMNNVRGFNFHWIPFNKDQIT